MSLSAGHSPRTHFISFCVKTPCHTYGPSYSFIVLCAWLRDTAMEARRCLFIDNRALVSFCAEYRFNSDVQIGTKIRLQWAMLAANVLGSWQLGAIISLITGF